MINKENETCGTCIYYDNLTCTQNKRTWANVWDSACDSWDCSVIVYDKEEGDAKVAPPWEVDKYNF